ncbi:hypothetical protein L9F63_001688, partial [Diploptera punctata]
RCLLGAVVVNFLITSSTPIYCWHGIGLRHDLMMDFKVQILVTYLGIIHYSQLVKHSQQQ